MHVRKIIIPAIVRPVNVMWRAYQDVVTRLELLELSTFSGNTPCYCVFKRFIQCDLLSLYQVITFDDDPFNPRNKHIDFMIGITWIELERALLP